MLTRQMVYLHDHNEAFVRWDFEDIWRRDSDYVHNQNSGVNNSYPYLFFQAEDPWYLDTPEIDIEIRIIEGAQYVVLSWEAIEDAASYLVYSSGNPEEDEWGDPVEIVENTQYSEIIADNQKIFFSTLSTIFVLFMAEY